MTEQATTSLDEQPPDRLDGDEDSYFRVSDFTDASKVTAALEALDEYSGSNVDPTDAVLADLAAKAHEHRFSQHAADDDCCLDDHDATWWCPFGSGQIEGLYVSFDSRDIDDADRARTEREAKQ
jgi:hypothetical protein